MYYTHSQYHTTYTLLYFPTYVHTSVTTQLFIQVTCPWNYITHPNMKQGKTSTDTSYTQWLFFSFYLHHYDVELYDWMVDIRLCSMLSTVSIPGVSIFERTEFMPHAIWFSSTFPLLPVTQVSWHKYCCTERGVSLIMEAVHEILP
jgi:hypothetical protein